MAPLASLKSCEVCQLEFIVNIECLYSLLYYYLCVGVKLKCVVTIVIA